MTDDGSASASTLTPHHTHTLNTVPEGEATTPTSTTHYVESRNYATSRSSQHHQHHHHHHHHQQHQQQPQKALADKRSRSSTTLNLPSSSCQSKYTSSTSMVASHSPKMRSNSVGTRPVTSMHPSRKTVAAHGDHPEQRTSTVTSQHKPRKHSSYSSTKT